MPCTTILVGKAATNDGSTIISRNDDGGFDTKQIVVVEPQKQKKKYKSVKAHLEIELPDNPLRYTMAPNVDRKDGLWAACGINAANVAMTATETISSNPRVLGADPYVEYKPRKGRSGKETPGGIGEEDITAIVLPYIRSAREGVVRLGELLEKYGTYEPNGIAFSDRDEIWWLETIGGHHWIARRVPDDRVVIMPNQFGLDNFDFEDAYGTQKEHLCSPDLRKFVEVNRLDTGRGPGFNPRDAFGSHDDGDHIYNTPRAWYMARYFLPRTFKWDGDGADFGPESNDIPWSFVPEKKVTIEDVRYLLGSHYQGTPYDPYGRCEEQRGKYRSIGVPNSDLCGILQIRGDLPEQIQALEWMSMGGSGFTACFPFYANVSHLPDYLSATPKRVSTEHMYWQSRLIAALTDAQYGSSVIHAERYQEAVFNRARQLICEYDRQCSEMLGADGSAAAGSGSAAAGDGATTGTGNCAEKSSEDRIVQLCEQANKKITDMVREESDKTLDRVLKNASEHMKIRYHRGDH